MSIDLDASKTRHDDEKADKQTLTALQFDYAWKWFNMHATQRTTMFNYFMIITGIMASAYVTALKDGMRGISVGIASIGVVASLAFYFLDCRNHHLVKMGENVLTMLEREYFFASPSVGMQSSPLGFLYKEEVEALVSAKIASAYSGLRSLTTIYRISRIFTILGNFVWWAK